MARIKQPLSDREKFCLCGYIATGDASTAYVLSRETPMKATDPKIIAKMASRWLNDTRAQTYISQRQRADYKTAKEDADAPTNRTRSEAIEELNTLVNSVTDPRIRADILLKLADLQRWKREETNRDDLVHFYIPLQTDRCIRLFAYKLKQRFGWSDEEAQEAEEIMSAGFDPSC